ncbi:MAG: SUMF1/EgtB/PvdO family nonheme iron enzyme [Paludibacteraceae bacterium]|nr:SUMF1/EgtB/PvdO family nonheme iron enzyme [Paludibacteraceae bacterium]
MKKKILFLFVYLCVSLLSVAQNALCIYPREGVDSLPIAFRVFGRMTYSENSFDITHRGGWLLYTSPYDDVQHISFIEHQPTYTIVFDTICAGEAYIWNGIEYKKPGVYTDTLQNIYGCDSIVELRLEVMPDPALTFTVNGVSFNMMRVRAGSFMMGATEKDTEAEVDEFPRHEVTLTKDFFIGETEMTQELWSAIMGTNPSADKSNPQSPVNMVTWDDCQQMIAKLNQLTGLTFRLPTEAEWEYAARGGQYSKGYKYAGSDNIDEVAWYNKSYYASVASLKPNELGLYDMSGSVYEWCQDYFSPNFYSSPNHQVDPFQAENVDGKRCLRGGSNEANQGVNRKKYSRIANRGHGDGTKVSSSNAWGLRLALEATGILVNNSVFVTYDTICSGETYTWNGNIYSRPGVYVDTLQNIYGCDSIVELRLEVMPDPALTFTVNGVSFNMMRVRAGSFMMGATPEQGADALADEKPAHQVILTRDYFIAETMLTQELWTAVMGTTIQEEEAKRSYGETNLGYGPNYPMYCLSYYDCLDFVEKLNELTGLTFRMPTEAEWEYAARGGHLSKGYKYPGSNDPLEVAWSNVNAPDRKLREVKLLKPNELGVYDMAGNVWEYIYDYRRIYTAESQVDPIGDITTNIANVRGGSTAWDAEYSRVSYRHVDSNLSKNDKSSRRAFRFVLDADLVIDEDNKNYLQFDTICSGEAYTWNGKKYYYSGTYTDTLQNIYGCDSIVELHLEVHPSYNSHEKVVACGSYEFNPFNIDGGGRILNESGVYSDTLQTIHGCDSIATIDLTVMPEAVTTTESVVIGSNELPYVWRGKEYNATGTYVDAEKYASAECDSAIHVLNLTVLTTGAVDRQSLAVCESELPYVWYGQTLETAGEYTHIEKYAGTTIDSVKHLLNFTVNKGKTITYTVTACDSYTWSDGNTYTESGVYYDSLQTIHGCDSIEVLTLTINNSVVVPYTVTTCDSYTWSDGNTYTESGVYYDSLQTIHGCDSVEVLTLTINNSVVVPYTVTACDSYTWSDGKTYTESGVYYDSLQTIHGCDSVEVLTLTINNSVVVPYTVTACDSYTWSDGNTYTE